MKAGIAFFLARHFSKGKISEAVFMALGVCAAVFTSASAANAAMAFRQESQRLLAAPDYLEIQVAPAALVRSNDEAIERLDADMSRAFAMPPDLAEKALLEVPSVLTYFSIQRSTFTVGEDPGAAARAQILGGQAGGGQLVEALSAFGGAFGAPPDAMQFGSAGNNTGGAATGTRTTGNVGGRDAMANLPPEQAALLEQARQFMQQPAADPTVVLETPLLERLSGARVDTAFFQAYRLKASTGDLFTDSDISERNPVLVAGASIAKELFEDGEALGKALRLNGVTYTIIGVLDSTTATNNNRSLNDMVFVPSTRFTFTAGGRTNTFSGGQLSFMAKDANSVGPALRELQAFFDRESGQNSMRLLSRKRELDERTAVQNTLFAAAFFLASLCVIVASLNLMNSAATHAVKRRKSLGMLRAIGATRANAVLAALFENAIPALAGMTAGLILALAFASRSVALLVPYSSNTSVSLTASIIAAIGAATLPLLLGIIPAVFFSRTAPATLVRPE